MGVDWQPMDTAPKDGTEILGVYAGVHGADYAIMLWTGNRWVAQADGQSAIESQSDFGTIYIEPFCTHWMPLPEPPKAK